MPYTVEDFHKEIALEHFNTLTVDEKMRYMSPDEILNHMATDEILRCKSADEISRHMSTEDLLRGLLNKSPRIKGLTKSEIKAYLKKIAENKK